MASECIYYQWNSGYYCNLARKEIDSDTVHRFCWSYNSEDCPLRRNQRSSDGCYLTSACVRAKHLPDDCKELQTLRAFRDNYLKLREDGEKDIREYYEKAPLLVEKINASEKSSSVYNRIYEEMVLPCVKLIEAQEHESAYQLYKEYSSSLMAQWGIA